MSGTLSGVSLDKMRHQQARAIGEQQQVWNNWTTAAEWDARMVECVPCPECEAHR